MLRDMWRSPMLALLRARPHCACGRAATAAGRGRPAVPRATHPAAPRGTGGGRWVPAGPLLLLLHRANTVVPF